MPVSLWVCALGFGSLGVCSTLFYRFAADEMVMIVCHLDINEPLCTRGDHCFSVVEVFCLLFSRIHSASDLYKLSMKYYRSNTAILEVVNTLAIFGLGNRGSGPGLVDSTKKCSIWVHALQQRAVLRMVVELLGPHSGSDNVLVVFFLNRYTSQTLLCLFGSWSCDQGTAPQNDETRTDGSAYHTCEVIYMSFKTTLLRWLRCACSSWTADRLACVPGDDPSTAAAWRLPVTTALLCRAGGGSPRQALTASHFRRRRSDAGHRRTGHPPARRPALVSSALLCTLLDCRFLARTHGVPRMMPESFPCEVEGGANMVPKHAHIEFTFAYWRLFNRTGKQATGFVL